MKKLVYTAMFIIAGFAASAQVKIGTTPTAIVSGAKLQIDGDATTTTANPSKMIVTSGGNIGIGTSAPGQILDVVATGGAAVDNFNLSSYGGAGSNPSPVFKANAASGTFASPGFLTSGNAFSGFLTGAWNGSSFSNVAGMQFNATENHSATALGSNLVFLTTANTTTAITERMRIDQNGNVGIGTTTPGYLLDVSGAANAVVGARINNTTAGANAVSELIFGTDQGASAYIFEGSSTTTGGAGANSLNIVNAVNGGPMALYTQAAERMRITGAGNVGIGTTTPSTLLHVNVGTANAAGTAPAFTLSDGSQANGYVLTSNASGGATWKAPNTIVYGTYGANLGNFALPANAPSGQNSANTLTPASITLPVGKWLVYVSCTVQLTGANNTSTTSVNVGTGAALTSLSTANIGSYWVGYGLSDANNTTATTGDVDTKVGTATFRQTLSTGATYVVPSGYIGIINTSGAPKTYYVFGLVNTLGSPNPSAGVLYWFSPFSSQYGERALFATPYN